MVPPTIIVINTSSFLLCALHVLSNLILNMTLRLYSAIASMKSWKNKGTEGISNLPKTTQLVNSMMGFRPTYLDSRHLSR